MIDVLYLAKGRREFTEVSLRALIANTNWSLVSTLYLYDDGSPNADNSRKTLIELKGTAPVNVVYTETNYASPVGVMNHYLMKQTSKADIFAKIDNDIMVPPGWLEKMSETLDFYSRVMLLGMQPGFGGPEHDGFDREKYGITYASHIGGVGLMRRSIFKRKGVPEPNGRFGFTEWQEDNAINVAWIKPDIQCFELDRLPIMPWKGISMNYVAQGIQRDWPLYRPEMTWYWEWAFPEEEA